MPRELHGPPDPQTPQHAPANRRLFAPLLWFTAAALVAVASPRFGSASPEHIADTYVVLHRGDSDADAWAQLAETLGPQLPGHVPLAPPPSEARAWRSAHLLYWIDAANQPELARRFEPDALRAAIASLRARMASPLFGLAGEDLRRDPLGLADLGGMHAPPPITSTTHGDLLSADGGTLLIHLQTAMATEALAAQVGAHSGNSPSLEIHTFPLPELSSQRSPAIIANLALLALVLALTLRRTRQSLIIAATVAAAAPLVVLMLGPMTSTAIGAAAALAVHGRRAAWTPVAAALVPLALLPAAPLAITLFWGLATTLLALAVWFVAPPLLALVRARSADPPTLVRPLPPVAALVACTALVAAGVFALRPARVDTHAADTPPALLGLLDIGRIASLTSRGDTPTAALEAAAQDARAVTDALPDAQLDGPARFVLDESTLSARAAALATLDLPGRGEFLRTTLAEHGLRPDAFGEFFQTLDPTRQPDPESALAGPIGPWLTAALRRDADGFTATTRVLLPVDPPDRLPPTLHGPAVAAHRARHDLPGHLALALVTGAWLSAFFAWLTTRRLAPALAAAAVAATAQVAALASVVAIHGEISHALLPALLVVGALTAALATPDTRPTNRDTPAQSGALASACLAAPGLVLLASPDKLTHATGLILAIGAALGGLLASHAAPGLSTLLRRREPNP